MSSSLADFSAHASALISARAQDVALYPLPSILLAPLIRYLANLHPVFSLLRLSGTARHKLAHASKRQISRQASKRKWTNSW